uniref:Uncharacterized protein n=1 Tax=Populus trichocarpa TaxID=3694 RepID=A0A2K1ZSD1_POPTR
MLLVDTVCNFSKGRWVVDSRWSLYSGKKCRSWLSGMWACRLTTRTDISYEGYRWQPENCTMPDFERTAFLRRMQHKTIAFIGDSIGRQQFQSLMCMATGGEDSSEVENVGEAYGLIKLPEATRPNDFAYRFTNTNTTILYYWSSSLSDLEPLNKANPDSKIAMLINTGNHWSKGKFKKNRWLIYINGKVNEDRNLARIPVAKNFTVHSIVQRLDSQISMHPRLKVFFRTISPRHFKHCPLTRGSEVLQEGSSDGEVGSAVNGLIVKILDIVYKVKNSLLH